MVINADSAENSSYDSATSTSISDEPLDPWWATAGREFQKRMVNWREPQPRLKIPEDPTAFDEHFTKHVVPSLRVLCVHAGANVAFGGVAYSDALNSVMREAVRRGADRLTDLDALEEYLALWIAEHAAFATRWLRDIEP